MADPAMNNLLRWGVENSAASRDGNTAAEPKTQLDPKALEAFFYGTAGTDAEQMEQAMDVIENESVPVKDRIIAFQNFHELVENIDNANSLEPLRLWTRLVNQLDKEEAAMREHAAWSCGAAVQNNVKAQERLLVVGTIPTLVRLATEDADATVRKKAIGALSSAIRNYPPGLDAVLSHVPANYKPEGKIDAGDMESVDSLIDNMRAKV